jgi:rieske iron-sulfur protein
MLGWAAGGALTSLPFMAGSAQATESVSHWLVDADAESDFKPLRLADLKPGKPLLVYPLNKKTGVPQNESRLNKLVITLLPEDKMTPETRARAASGVLAYSGICTHQGCEVKTWIAKESVLACFCHASKFALLDNANVVSGPATKALPAVALTMDGDYLAIANTGSPTSGQ